jgi:ring-1,2-phenylacetyl-CoA epoxidase subunit PaaD
VVTEDAGRVVAKIVDPELPMVTIADLGILRDVEVRDGRVCVTITPTYSGCPAIAEIAHDVRARLAEAGYRDVDIRSVLTPPWSSEWITPAGRHKLAAAGVAPPAPATRRSGPIPLTLRPCARVVPCPHCGSAATQERSRFGSTACKALYRCDACAEPFEYLKDI